ncbi:FAD-binding oxidoreductase [Streptomyces sp. NBRC 109706]|uniref:FAD-binding oxidoreductase n=1 Tax=Streptomyces sp. NBRC 109706 TaxID=1550035 RepID=UPI000A86BE01|nr:FAD-binding oxidoreductase [Streptomyces sp. NBRC 109706]
MVVGAARTADVRAAVRFAVDNGLPVGVQAAGHGCSAPAEGGVLITTGRMSGVVVDPRRRTVTVEAGVRFEQVIPAAAQHGLAPLGGSAPHVGVVGYVLGGGVGLLVRTYGYAADRVCSLEVVTADGSLLRVTPDTEPDLYWALLGGRDNFGIVTRLEMGLVPVERLYGGGLFFDARATPDLLSAYIRWTRDLPEEMNSSVALIPFPEDPEVPGVLRGRHVYHLRVAYTGNAREATRLLEPLRAMAGPPLIEALHDMPYTQSASIHDEPSVAVPFVREVALFREFDQDTIDTVLEHAGPQSPLPIVVEVRHLGGALATPPRHPNAVGHRDATYLLSVVVLLFGVTEDDTRRVFGKLFDALRPWSIGTSLNFMGHGRNAGGMRLRAAYTPADLERLAALKAAHDPSNLFRLNYNIPPAVGRE